MMYIDYNGSINTQNMENMLLRVTVETGALFAFVSGNAIKFFFNILGLIYESKVDYNISTSIDGVLMTKYDRLIYITVLSWIHKHGKLNHHNISHCLWRLR